jgi:hypothetical protein
VSFVLLSGDSLRGRLVFLSGDLSTEVLVVLVSWPLLKVLTDSIVLLSGDSLVFGELCFGTEGFLSGDFSGDALEVLLVLRSGDFSIVSRLLMSLTDSIVLPVIVFSGDSLLFLAGELPLGTVFSGEPAFPDSGLFPTNLSGDNLSSVLFVVECLTELTVSDVSVVLDSKWTSEDFLVTSFSTDL